MQDPIPENSNPGGRGSIWPGLLCCLISMILYGCTNVTLRFLNDRADSVFWIMFNKELVSVGLLAPWVLFRFFQGRYHFVSKRLVLYLVISGLICQIFGTQGQLLGYAIIGLVVATPLIQSSQLIAAAGIGKTFLHESVTLRKWMAIAVLMVSVIFLCSSWHILDLLGFSVPDGIFEKSTSPAGNDFPGRLLFGGLVAVAAGLAFAVNVSIIRYASKKHWNTEFRIRDSLRITDWIGYDRPRKVPGEIFYSPLPITLIMIIITGVGVVVFGCTIFVTKGPDGFIAASDDLWPYLIFCGLTNFVGFFFQVQALRHTTAVQVSLIAATQIVFITIIGIVSFKESANSLIWTGTALAILGIFLSTEREKE